MNTQTTINLSSNKDILTLFATLEEHAGEEMSAVKTEDGAYVIWAKDNSFPISVLNEGTPGVKDWDGHFEVVDTLHALLKKGYTAEMVCREEGDETEFDITITTQDYKLVITQ